MKARRHPLRNWVFCLHIECMCCTTLFTTYLQISIGVNTLDPVFNRSTDNPGNPGYQCANAIILFPM